jgi:outer membrane lipoprotein-sorting protein
MRRRTLFILIAVVALAAILIVGVVTAGAKGSSKLTPIGVQKLLHNVATNAAKTTAINGDFAWSNGLLGTSSLLSLGGNQTPSGLSSLLLGGSGRLWLQDGKMRLESQGQNGDLVAIANGTTAWTWDSVTNTATKYALPTPAADTSTPMAAPSSSLDPTTAIANLIAKLAPTATLSLGDQQVVAHRDAYILKLTPTSPTTTVAAIEVAIDGHRWVPLRVQVFAKGASGAVLSAGFASVSYKPVAAGLFSFTPPSGATVAHKDLSSSLQGLQSAATAQPQISKKASPLTLAQAKTAASFVLAPSSTPTGLNFQGAFVTPITSQGTTTKLAVLHYGTSFGSVVVVETPASARQDSQIAQQLGQLSMIGKTTVNGTSATKLQTSLVSAVTFTQGGVRVVVVGLVPFGDITQIAGSLK